MNDLISVLVYYIRRYRKVKKQVYNNKYDKCNYKKVTIRFREDDEEDMQIYNELEGMAFLDGGKSKNQYIKDTLKNRAEDLRLFPYNPEIYKKED